MPFGDAPAGSVTDATGRTLAADGTGTLPGQAIPMLSGPDDHQVSFAIPDTGPLTYSVPNSHRAGPTARASSGPVWPRASTASMPPPGRPT